MLFVDMEVVRESLKQMAKCTAVHSVGRAGGHVQIDPVDTAGGRSVAACLSMIRKQSVK